MAFRVLAALAVISVVAGIGLFFLHAFSYVIAVALAAVFAGCASRWASTAAAALWASSFLYAFVAMLATVYRDPELGGDGRVRHVATDAIEGRALTTAARDFYADPLAHRRREAIEALLQRCDAQVGSGSGQP